MPEDGASMGAVVDAGCRDCAWFRTVIGEARGAGDDRSAADLEALQGRHLHQKHDPDARSGRNGLPGV
ncbi:hypothetical protein FM076_28585 [Streptomyces albus subsp. chlorinus]|uniref:hypothetical protein n=1 Tax=Streptomyces albus TaxID=1888 RepID=UPI00156FB1E8|nr:hypothetical protein [Streptomyces albus]NSC24902.1 hypothetical protein [Streptomyces albus subsp. chlorinus]